MGGRRKKSRFRTCLSKPRLRESPGFWTSKPGIIPKPFSIQRPSRDDRRQPGSSPHTVPLPCPPTTSVPCTMRTHGPPSCCLPAAFLLPSCCLAALARCLNVACRAHVWPALVVRCMAHSQLLGLLVWEDWRTITRPVAYLSCHLLMLPARTSSPTDLVSSYQRMQGARHARHKSSTTQSGQSRSRPFSKKTAAAVTLGMPTALKAVSAKSGGAVDQVTV